MVCAVGSVFYPAFVLKDTKVSFSFGALAEGEHSTATTVSATAGATSGTGSNGPEAAAAADAMKQAKAARAARFGISVVDKVANSSAGTPAATNKGPEIASGKYKLIHSYAALANSYGVNPSDNISISSAAAKEGKKGHSGGKASGKTVEKRLPLALIVEPTRELAEQVYQNVLELTRYVKDPTINAALLVSVKGGQHSKQQGKQKSTGKDSKDDSSTAQLSQGQVDIVVGTAGALHECLKNQSLDLSQVPYSSTLFSSSFAYSIERPYS